MKIFQQKWNGSHENLYKQTLPSSFEIEIQCLISLLTMNWINFFSNWRRKIYASRKNLKTLLHRKILISSQSIFSSIKFIIMKKQKLITSLFSRRIKKSARWKISDPLPGETFNSDSSINIKRSPQSETALNSLNHF